MTSKEEILRLLTKYSRTVDSGDLDGFAELFSNGEWYVEGTSPSVGSDEIRQAVTSQIIIYDDGTPRTRHVNSNIDIEVDEESGTATCQRYVTILQQTESHPLQVIASGDYKDSFVKRNGTWSFASTVIRRPFLGDMSRHMKNITVVTG